LAGKGGAGATSSGESAALPAGQAAGLDQMLTSELWVAGVGAEGWPARGFGGGRRRWPRRLGERRRGNAMLGNTRACELHQGLGKLPEQLAGGEHGWKHELVAAAMAAVRLEVAHWGARSCFYRRLGASVGDGG
jgi:hypothetical protein